VQLHRARGKFEKSGIDVVLIGQATPRHAAHFRRRLEVDFQILADENRASYEAAGAKIATMNELLGPTSVAKGLARTMRSGGRIRQGRTIGHPAQLGGAMLITRDGKVAWSHMSEDASDNASADEILAAARETA
jgi:peroxiredoxin